LFPDYETRKSNARAEPILWYRVRVETVNLRRNAQVNQTHSSSKLWIGLLSALGHTRWCSPFQALRLTTAALRRTILKNFQWGTERAERFRWLRTIGSVGGKRINVTENHRWRC